CPCCRLKAKEEEWRDAQQGFNKVWREHYEKAYLKSLDHQAASFKQTDTKALRSKSLLNEIESVYDEHQEQHSEGRGATSEPHLIFVYEDKQILDDAAALIGYYVKRQPTIQKEDQATIRHIVHRFVPDLFFSQPPEQPATKETPSEEKMGLGGPPPDTRDLRRRSVVGPPMKASVEKTLPALSEMHELRKRAPPLPPTSPLEEKPPVLEGHERRKRHPPIPPASPAKDKRDWENAVSSAGSYCSLDNVYTLFFANNNWYFFLRLHQTLCARLLKIYRQAQKQLLEYRTEKEREKLLCEGRKERANDPAMELRLKQPSEVELEEYYPAFLDLVRNLLDGNIDPTQYEDTLREMFTIHAYIGFTMDKLVQNIVRQVRKGSYVCIKCSSFFPLIFFIYFTI
ncbi:paired amphipathic helix protein Sin3b-like, partial [Sceloporus undulatus]|uniref:paired amphipathic helix protein Sin3b-like n=1 Tax=Sceloporus undulatus TaxID=8520 RepID=UPI001C4B472D